MLTPKTMILRLVKIAAISALAAISAGAQTLDLGSQRELMVDHYLIDKLQGAKLRAQIPLDRGVAFNFDRPYEGAFSGYVSIVTLPNGQGYRAYYRGLPVLAKAVEGKGVVAYAESQDGVTWIKPDDNVVMRDTPMVTHNFAVFYDSRPGVPANEQWKGIGGINDSGLIRYVSADGLSWRPFRGTTPLLEETEEYRYDSLNLAFWSESEQQYVLYYRNVRRIGGTEPEHSVRNVSRAVSADFVTWTEEGEMRHRRVDGTAAPIEQLYTNQTTPYFRAPQHYIAIAARFHPNRQVLTEKEAEAVGVHPKFFKDISESVLMTSRGGTIYDRTFMEAFGRPGLGLENWTSRNNYPAWGVIQTGPEEMSFYARKKSGQPDQELVRYSLRLDGFASLHAGYDGGEMVTKPFTFTGSELEINYATSAYGSLRFELQDSEGFPLPGFALADSREIIGDQIERVVSWTHGSDLSALFGRTVRLRVVLQDADLFSLRFRPSEP